MRYDREVKAIAYAKSGIADYWILDVNQRKLHVYRLPSSDGYQSETILSFICDDFTAGIWCYSDRSTAIITTCKLRSGDRSFHSTSSVAFLIFGH
nr:Uma2 family endonuclease [Hassalia byssoidea]